MWVGEHAPSATSWQKNSLNRLRGEGIFPMPFGQTTSPGTFGGLGAGSTMFWVDPERELVFALLTAGLLEEGASILRHQRMSDLVVSAVID